MAVAAQEKVMLVPRARMISSNWRPFPEQPPVRSIFHRYFTNCRAIESPVAEIAVTVVAGMNALWREKQQWQYFPDDYQSMGTDGFRRDELLRRKQGLYNHGVRWVVGAASGSAILLSEEDYSVASGGMMPKDSNDMVGFSVDIFDASGIGNSKGPALLVPYVCDIVNELNPYLTTIVPLMVYDAYLLDVRGATATSVSEQIQRRAAIRLGCAFQEQRIDAVVDDYDHIFRVGVIDRHACIRLVAEKDTLTGQSQLYVETAVSCVGFRRTDATDS